MGFFEAWSLMQYALPLLFLFLGGAVLVGTARLIGRGAIGKALLALAVTSAWLMAFVLLPSEGGMIILPIFLTLIGLPWVTVFVLQLEARDRWTRLGLDSPKNLAGYLEQHGMSLADFQKTMLYSMNEDRVPWLDELEALPIPETE